MEKLQKATGYFFKNPELLEQALTHRSRANSDSELPSHFQNERLEFLGDSVLNLIVTDFLFKTYPHKSEGDLTVLKSILVSGPSLALCAEQWNLGSHLRLSHGEEKAGGRQKKALLADCFEAFLGAVWLDGGMQACRKVLDNILFNRLDSIFADEDLLNHKSRLLELYQQGKVVQPEFRLMDTQGPEHDRQYTIKVFLGAESFGEGMASTKKKAEQVAACETLKLLEGIDNNALETD
jgi:ribonuclease-3